ncbi:MAG: membrane protein insertase YidC [Campylobacterota bacterium]|nr:membrane protein insertase YidC [Campylobacterota bacterium]
MAINNNNMNKEQTQKRILIATALSFAFFIAYDFLYLQPQQAAVNLANEKNAAVVVKQNNTATSTNAPVTNSAPQVAQNNSPVTQPSTKAPVSGDAVVADVITTIETSVNTIKIDNLGRIAQVILKGSQYIDDNGKKIKLFAADQLRPLEIRFANANTNSEAFKVNFVASASSINATNSKTTLTLTQKLTDTTLTKVLTFYPDGHYDLDVSSTNNADFFITPGFRPDVIADMYADHGALLALNDGTLTIVEDEDMDRGVELIGVNAASAFDRYYTTLLYNFNRSMAVSVMMDSTESPNMFIHAKNKIELHGYAGPKDFNVLTALDERLSSVIEYGWFTFIAKPMFVLLQFLHGYIGNWGWTIVFTTILIKLVLFPLSHKGMKSMNKLKDLAPKVKALQEKYKDDKQKASMHMMELYKKEGANPMGGCLPMILQIPVFFAIYRVLLNAIELKGAPWILWIEDLGAMDPYFVLPILMGATMWLQQKITPNTMTDPMQQKMFQLLPVVFTFFFLWFPAGLTLYWFINNLFTIAQQYYVNRLFETAKEQRHEKHLDEKKHNKKK